jgi:hypothetical protein
MNPGELSIIESKRLALIQQLRVAETALRGNLHLHGIDGIARAHMERALAHVHEAFIAINETGHARTVQQLADESAKVERLLEELRQQPPPGIVVKANRI